MNFTMLEDSMLAKENRNIIVCAFLFKARARNSEIFRITNS